MQFFSFRSFFLSFLFSFFSLFLTFSCHNPVLLNFAFFCCFCCFFSCCCCFVLLFFFSFSIRLPPPISASEVDSIPFGFIRLCTYTLTHTDGRARALSYAQIDFLHKQKQSKINNRKYMSQPTGAPQQLHVIFFSISFFFFFFLLFCCWFCFFFF